MRIPDHVLHAFQLDGQGVAVPAPWGGVRFGKVVVAPASHASVWSGKVRERIAPQLAGVRVSRPVRATDGRLVVGGFAANEFEEGSPAARVDEVVGASLLIDATLNPINPPSQSPAGDVWLEADRAVWAGEDLPGERVVAHLDLLASCLFDGLAAPFVAGFSPSGGARPRGYTAAVVMVDGLLADAVDARIVERWAHIPQIRALVAKALEFRELGFEALGSNMRADLRRVGEIVSA